MTSPMRRLVYELVRTAQVEVLGIRVKWHVRRKQAAEARARHHARQLARIADARG